MDIIVTILIVVGLVFFTGGTLGILRFPDYYSRLPIPPANWIPWPPS